MIKPTKQENLNECIKNSIIINNISNERCIGSGLSEDDASVTVTTAATPAERKAARTAIVWVGVTETAETAKAKLESARNSVKRAVIERSAELEESSKAQSAFRPHLGAPAVERVEKKVVELQEENARLKAQLAAPVATVVAAEVDVVDTAKAPPSAFRPHLSAPAAAIAIAKAEKKLEELQKVNATLKSRIAELQAQSAAPAASATASE